MRDGWVGGDRLWMKIRAQRSAPWGGSILGGSMRESQCDDRLCSTCNTPPLTPSPARPSSFRRSEWAPDVEANPSKLNSLPNERVKRSNGGGQEGDGGVELREPLCWGLEARRNERGFLSLARLLVPRQRRTERCERSSERGFQLLDHADSTFPLETGGGGPTLQVRPPVSLHRINSYSPSR